MGFSRQRYLQPPIQYEQEFFAGMSIRTSAPLAWRDVEQVRFHDRVAPCKQRHAHPRPRFQHLALARTHHCLRRVLAVKEIENVKVKKSGELAQGPYGRRHLPTFESAQEPDGDADRSAHVSQRQLTLYAHLAKLSTETAP